MENTDYHRKETQTYFRSFYGYKLILLETLYKLNSHFDKMAGTLTVLTLTSTLWLIIFTLSNGSMNISSESFALLLLLSTSLCCGLLFKLFLLPPLLGMILIGLVWKNWNVTAVDVAALVSTKWSSILRNMATVIILLRGGYGLNHTVVIASWPVVLRMSLLPCLTETTTWGLLAHFLLDMPWLWGFLTGFVISAASAAIVIPMMLNFQEQGLGNDKGIPTIAIASTAIDNVLAMTAFGILLSFIFTTEDLTTNLIQIPVQLAVGIAFGFAWGMISSYVPRKGIREGHLIGSRMLLLLCGGIIAVFGSKALDYQGAGPLACVLMGFIANITWKKNSGWGQLCQPNPIGDMLSGLWVFFEAMLFVLIGTQISVSSLKSPLIGYGVLVMLLAWLVRFIVTGMSVTGAGLDHKENGALAIAWLGKATVQAALGPVALEMAEQMNADAQTRELALLVLNLAALSILVTAPVGALALQFAAPRLLNKSNHHDTPDENIPL